MAVFLTSLVAAGLWLGGILCEIGHHQQRLVRSVWILQWEVLAVEHGKLGQELVGLADWVLLLVDVDHVLVLAESNLANADLIIVEFKVLLE